MKQSRSRSSRGCAGMIAAPDGAWQTLPARRRACACRSEYLAGTRRGVVDRAASGQGMRIFAAVGSVPRSCRRRCSGSSSSRDQITRERIGVGVAGIAVFRIAEPMLAFRVIDFMQPDATDRLGAARCARCSSVRRGG